MAKTNLIIGNSDDYHALALNWALNRLQFETYIWDGIGDFGGGRISLRPGVQDAVAVSGRAQNDIHSIWYRRPVAFQMPEGISEESRSFIETELRESYVATCTMMNDAAAFVVGNLENRAVSSKAIQLKMAHQVGFNIPETLISNDYDEIMSFAKNRRMLAVKHFAPHYWMSASRGGARFVHTSLVNDMTKFSKRSIELSPCIYQEFIEKKYEIRATVIGKRIFAAKIEDSSGGAFVDWRFEVNQPRFRMAAMKMDGHTSLLIIKLMDRLGLKFGCFDFVVDINNNVYFLEINPGGQFLFVESLVPELKLLQAMTSMLVAGSTTYDLLEEDGIDVKSFEQTAVYKRIESGERQFDRASRYMTQIA